MIYFADTLMYSRVKCLSDIKLKTRLIIFFSAALKSSAINSFKETSLLKMLMIENIFYLESIPSFLSVCSALKYPLEPLHHKKHSPDLIKKHIYP